MEQISLFKGDRSQTGRNRSLNYRRWCLSYESTNEQIPAIIAGLDVQEEDRILAICGSGDQAFAMLEYADFVQAIDINPRQVRICTEESKTD